MNKISTILMGTPEFAENIFCSFYDTLKDKFEIIAVVTAPDKPVGRKQILTPSPVKSWAIENNLPVLQPDKIRKPEWVEKIKTLNPELIILTAFGQIIPEEILNIPKYKALNIHPSLLPKYRGASPIQSVILNGETETGVCLMIMDKEMDHGPVLANSKQQIANSITFVDLSKQLSNLGAQLLIKTLPDWVEGKIKAQEQDHSQATFCKIIKKEDGKIDWSKSAEEIERQVRAYSIWPIAYCDFNGKVLKILEVSSENKKTGYRSGEVFLDENKKLCVQTRNGLLILKEIQLEGKKPTTVKEFLNGHKEIIGTILQ